MKLRQLLTVASTAALVSLAPHQAGAQTATLADDTHVETVGDSAARAAQLYANGQFREAFGHYYWAAIRDDARSQEMVGVMLLMGQGLYGGEVAGNRADALFWLREAASRGRDTAARLAQALARSTSAQAGDRLPSFN